MIGFSIEQQNGPNRLPGRSCRGTKLSIDPSRGLAFHDLLDKKATMGRILDFSAKLALGGALALTALARPGFADAGGFAVLHAFEWTDGYYPEAALIADKHGNLYGTTTNGGSRDDGDGTLPTGKSWTSLQKHRSRVRASKRFREPRSPLTMHLGPES